MINWNGVVQASLAIIISSKETWVPVFSVPSPEPVDLRMSSVLIQGKTITLETAVCSEILSKK